ncbi:hypothetical protein [Sphingomonas psychrotolerans]|uniref:Uncharacterized protein n=1 Tax=Sphingomonas psychrotolerans TaxID=1327635 RepID=A0A2K8MHT7_9SPHN|nr:hypothetical protein [Sphingomonas psychrotolerans]ATY30731.1 hypothetical protein CVN68_00940 [Sphingomonas psychrotolerans]
MRELVPAWFRATVLPAFLPAALFAGLSASAPASAQDYPARNVGGWTVAASKDARGCFLTRTYAGTGETTLLLGLDVDGGNRVSVLNDNWSIKPKARWKLTFKLTSGGYSDHPVVGMASDGKKGFVTTFDAKFPSHFAGSKAMHIYRGKVPVEQLTLDGSGAAIAELRRCVGMHAATPATGVRGKERSDRIPRDPFAPDARRRSGE